MGDAKEQTEPRLGGPSNGANDAFDNASDSVGQIDTPSGTSDQSQTNATSDATAFYSQVPNPSSFSLPPEKQFPYGNRQETIQYASSPLSSFNLGRMTAALPTQPSNMVTSQWMQPVQQQPDRHSGGMQHRGPSDHTYPPAMQPIYYSDYSAAQGATGSPTFVPPQYMQYQARYMHNQSSPGYIPNHQQQQFAYSPHSHQAYGSPAQAFFAPGHNQPFPVSYPAPVQQLRPGQLGYPLSMSGISSRSTVSDVAGASAAARPDIAIQTIPRGPPRKPRQSGHALWVGNLPPGATVVDLKDHFSREATKDIESLKLISKSNCAFVNYRTHAACAAAMERFHDSRFHGTKLVCRLRRTTPVSPAVPQQSEMSPVLDAGEEAPQEPDQGETVSSPVATGSMDNPPAAAEGLPERFFVMKSLTLQDLEVSTRTGMWATQVHNEERLNSAFESADNVYLFFSANKSGEYFGYARMASKIGAAATGPGDQASSSESGSGNIASNNVSMEAPPKSIPTAETEWAPKGRIIDDMARGTIFWEADIDDELDGVGEGETRSPDSSQSPPIVSSGKQEPAIASSTASANSSIPRKGSQLDAVEIDEPSSSSPGKAFQVEWLSVKKLPFYKCRGLRNPWNANREVKIARDGTELETNVGKKLLMFFGSPQYGMR